MVDSHLINYRYSTYAHNFKKKMRKTSFIYSLGGLPPPQTPPIFSGGGCRPPPKTPPA